MQHINGSGIAGPLQQTGQVSWTPRIVPQFGLGLELLVCKIGFVEEIAQTPRIIGSERCEHSPDNVTALLARYRGFVDRRGTGPLES